MWMEYCRTPQSMFDVFSYSQISFNANSSAYLGVTAQIIPSSSNISRVYSVPDYTGVYFVLA